MIDISHPDRIQGSGSLTEVKQVSHVTTTACHTSTRPITRRVKGRVEVTTSHFSRSFYMITSHDLWQQHHLPRFLTAVSRVAMTMLPPNVIMTNIKYLLTINEKNSTHDTIYKPLRKKEGNRQIPSKRPTDSYLPLLTMANRIIGGCIRTPCPDVFCRYNDWIKNLFWVEVAHSSIWQLRGALGTRGINNINLAWGGIMDLLNN